MQINPNIILANGILKPCESTECQQNGIDVTVSETITVPAKGFLNVLCNETVDIPSGMFATTNIRSSFSRKGIFTTTGLWDSGYCIQNDDGTTSHAPVGCSIYNLGDEDITIEKDTRIMQMVFWQGEEAEMYDGHYNQTQSIESQFDK